MAFRNPRCTISKIFWRRVGEVCAVALPIPAIFHQPKAGEAGIAVLHEAPIISKQFPHSNEELGMYPSYGQRPNNDFSQADFFKKKGTRKGNELQLILW